MMNCQIDEEDPCDEDIERGPELRSRGLGDHPCDFCRRQRPDGLVEVIHKRLRSTNLSVEEDVGEPREDEIDRQRKRQETQEGPHSSLAREQCMFLFGSGSKT